MDFGLANLMKMEMLASNCGSPTYCAPEILQSRKYIAPEVDIWSIGCILYAMVTGNCPWPGETLQEQVAYTLKGKYATIPSHVSSECKDLISRILTVDPKLRPTLAEIQKHPWVNIGYEKLPMEAPNVRPKSPKLDLEIVAQLQGFGFEKDEIVNDILSNKSLKQSYVLYYLLLDQKKRNDQEMQTGFPKKRSSWSGKIPSRRNSFTSDSEDSSKETSSSKSSKKKVPHLFEKIFRKSSKEDVTITNSPPKSSRKLTGVEEQTNVIISAS